MYITFINSGPLHGKIENTKLYICNSKKLIRINTRKLKTILELMPNDDLRYIFKKVTHLDACSILMNMSTFFIHESIIKSGIIIHMVYVY